jgi:hypothetical protein
MSVPPNSFSKKRKPRRQRRSGVWRVFNPPSKFAPRQLWSARMQLEEVAGTLRQFARPPLDAVHPAPPRRRSGQYARRRPCSKKLEFRPRNNGMTRRLGSCRPRVSCCGLAGLPNLKLQGASNFLRTCSWVACYARGQPGSCGFAAFMVWVRAGAEAATSPRPACVVDL